MSLAQDLPAIWNSPATDQRLKQRIVRILIREIVAIYRQYPAFKTEVLVASVRSTLHVIEAAKLGAHVATLPPAVLRQMFAHPLTDKGLQAFLSDWAKTGQSILGDEKKKLGTAAE